MAHDPNDAAASPVKEDPALDSLEARLAAAQKAEAARLARDHAPYADARSGAVQVASTMVGYPLGGIIIGYGLDRFVFNTLPWITIGLMFLAFIGACLQVIRANSNRAK